MHFGFSVIIWSIFIDMAGVAGLPLQTILYSIYFQFLGLVRAFLGPTIFTIILTRS
jgi:hypothetical protein